MSDPLPDRVRAGAKVLCRQEGAVLLVQEEHEDGTPFWTLPGGGVHPGEPPWAAAQREVREELQCDVTGGDRVGQMWYRHRSKPATVTQYAVFAGTLVSSPAPNPDQGVRAYRWADVATPPVRTLSCVKGVLQRLDEGDLLLGSSAEEDTRRFERVLLDQLNEAIHAD